MSAELSAIEWTHGDGMDQHAEYALLTDAQRADIETLLLARGGLVVYVYRVEPTTDYRALWDMIDADLPPDDGKTLIAGVLYDDETGQEADPQ